MPFSIDLRERVLATIKDGVSIIEVAEIFKISRRVIYNWIDLYEKTSNLLPKTGYQKGHSHKIVDFEQFKSFVKAYKECTVSEMIIQWEKITNMSISESAMWRALKKINRTSKQTFNCVKASSKKRKKPGKWPLFFNTLL